MKLLSIHSFPKAIMHMDADSFFASVESAKNPKLRGKPVVTGHERGIATSISKEAKALGITRGIPIFEIKRKFKDVIVVPSDYEAYSMYSNRMFNIVRRYTDVVEKYSIDECFADLTDYRKINNMTYKEILKKIQDEIEKELGISVSLGCAPTKVLAKVGSKWAKPHGVTMIPGKLAHQFLFKIPIGNIWGIGTSSTSLLLGKGIKTAYDFAILREEKVYSFANSLLVDIWNELNCRQVMLINTCLEQKLPKSISRTLSFNTTTNKKELFAELTRNVENACIRARKDGLAAKSIKWFLKTNKFQFQKNEIKLDRPTNSPTIILDLIWKQFENINMINKKYRTTGVIFNNLCSEENIQNDLFDLGNKISKQKELFDVVDKLALKYGRNIVRLASGIKACNNDNRDVLNGRIQNIFYNRIRKTGKELKIPYLGETV